LTSQTFRAIITTLTISYKRNLTPIILLFVKGHLPLDLKDTIIEVSIMVINTHRFIHALTALILLFILVSGCTRTYFYGLEEKVHYDSGYVEFYIIPLDGMIALSKDMHYKKDSVYSDFERDILRYRNIEFDSSKYTYLGLGNHNWANDRTTVPKTFHIADSIKLFPKSPFEFPEYDALEKNNWAGQASTRSMSIEPILVPREYNDDFEIEFVLSVYKKSDSTLLMRKPVSLKIKYKSRYYSPFIQGQ